MSGYPAEYEDILQWMLDRVPDDLDKREGSLIYIAVAPIAAAIAEQRFYGDNIMDATMPDTARGEDLIRRCAEHGVNIYRATSAVRKGIFSAPSGAPAVVGLGDVFGAEGLRYDVTAARGTPGVYELTCQTAGSAGNLYVGSVLPINNGFLGTAQITDVLVPGEDQEPDEEFRARFYREVNADPFGGNIAQYEEQVLAIPGVGDCKIFPTPEDVGGRVHIIIVGPGNVPAPAALVSKVKETLDPAPEGKGYGLAPIGHTVSVSTVTQRPIDVAASVAVVDGYTLEGLRPAMTKVVVDYLQSLAFRDNVVRLARVEAAILGIEGVADITDSTLCGGTVNLALANDWDCYEVPALGALTVTEVP